MSLREEWGSLVARVEGLMKAATFVSELAKGTGSDGHGISNSALLPDSKGVFASIIAFRGAHKTMLPPKAEQAISRFASTHGKLFEGDKLSGFPGVQAALALLQCVSAEVASYLNDAEFMRYRRVERAFEHLKRSIVVDDQLAKRWDAAFTKHETHCERLGSVHLLSHGLWGFKASGTGAATDLVLGSSIQKEENVTAAADALVLTEWKRVKDPKDLTEHVTQAQAQAKKYVSGLLGGVELRSYRYLVFVSEKDLSMPADVLDGAVRYRHINIPIRPNVPSASAT